ncbi:MAG: oligosaccharide flippase family protein [Pseudomonadota bacterium]
MARSFLVNAGALGVSRLFLSVSQVLALPVVARYLGPAEFGDMAIAMTVVIFTQLLSDAGLGRSLIRQPTIVDPEWNSVFWLLAGVGIALMVAILLIAPGWSLFYDRPQLQALLWALAPMPFFGAISAVPIARMERDGQFPKVALIRTVAGVLGLVGLLGLTISGFGVWALVAQQLIVIVVQAAWATISSAFRPGLPRRFTPLGGHIRFASDNVGVSVIYTAQRQAPVMLIGALLGAAPAGFFVMANRFLNLPRFAVSGPVSQVAYVRMAAQQQDRARLAETYIATCHLLSIVVFVPLAILAAGAIPVFNVVLSDTWEAAAVVFFLAAPGIAIELATSTLGVLLQAVDQTRLRLWMVIERTLLRIAAVAIAVQFGLEAVALTMTLFAIAYTPRYLSFAQRVTPLRQADVYRAMALPTLASALAAAAVFWASMHFSDWQMLAIAGIAIPVTLAAAALPRLKRIRSDLALLSG